MVKLQQVKVIFFTSQVKSSYMMKFVFKCFKFVSIKKFSTLFVLLKLKFIIFMWGASYMHNKL